MSEMTAAIEVGPGRRRAGAGTCPFCRRWLPLTFHHLIPKKLHRRRRFRKDFSRDTLAQGILICRACHSAIHHRYDEMELATRLNTPASLLADPPLRRHFDWLARQRRAVAERAS